MVYTIQCRLAGYVCILALHAFTCYDVLTRLSVTTEDPIVADFATLQLRFLTIWTLLLQIVYAIVGLISDVVDLRGSDYPTLFTVRETMFSALVFPTSLLVPIMFWPLYLSDPRNVFPVFIDKILSEFNNQVLHIYILFFALWEVVFLEKMERRYSRDLSMLAGYIVAYLFVLVGSYIERDEWIYPILDKIHGTIYFPIFFAAAAVILMIAYYIQWPLADFFQYTSAKKKSKKKSKKKRQ